MPRLTGVRDGVFGFVERIFDAIVHFGALDTAAFEAVNHFCELADKLQQEPKQANGIDHNVTKFCVYAHVFVGVG